MPDSAAVTNGKSRAGFVLKIFITGALLWLILAKVEYRETVRIIMQLDRSGLWVAVLLAIAAVVLSAYKWRIILAARGWNLSLAALTKVYFTGLFFNNFLPSSIGGDLMRIYLIGKKIGSSSEAAASVILERVLATVGLAIPVLLAVIPNRRLLGSFQSVLVYFFIFCLALVILVIRPSVAHPMTQISWSWWQKCLDKLRAINKVIQSYGQRKGAVVRVIGYSVLFQFSIVLINYFLMLAMGINHITLWQCTFIIPLISAVSMVPVSINGLGIREGAYVLLFTPLGLSTTQAVTLSLIFFIIVTAISLLGGISFVMQKEKNSDIITG